MATHGYTVVGCDLSYVLLRTGLRQYGEMRVALSDMRDLPFRDGTFQGLVNFFTSFGYFETERDNQRVVEEMSRVLVRGATFLFDYLNVHHEIRRMTRKEVRETDSGRVEIERWFDSSARAFSKRITIDGRHFLERVRGYDLEEIAAMFAAAEFRIRDVFGDFDGSGYHQASPRLIVVGTKN